jgi:hypothetical protein
LKLHGGTETAVFELLAAAAWATVVPAEALERIPVGLAYEVIEISVLKHSLSAVPVFLAIASQGVV